MGRLRIVPVHVDVYYDTFIDCCLTSSEQYFSFIHEDKLQCTIYIVGKKCSSFRNGEKSESLINFPALLMFSFKKNVRILCLACNFQKSKATTNIYQKEKINKGNNKITELRTILQRESQNS